ncbi:MULTISPECIES: hypothetical protein [Salimicrobium]|uniref:Uncharacterized protein n=1 Tax=Salimicrobium humidisoli TaxID=2029857 RepID=A0ABX4HTJ5_9BACI|nr:MULTISPECIES: hypothetical protein [Salimicrobium]PBB06546.1 hypothetical protein CKW00_02540 [Salimicrobium humidisoli]
MEGKKFYMWIGVIAYISWPLYFLLDQSGHYNRTDVVEAMGLITAMLLVYAGIVFVYFKKT